MKKRFFVAGVAFLALFVLLCWTHPEIWKSSEQIDQARAAEEAATYPPVGIYGLLLCLPERTDLTSVEIHLTNRLSCGSTGNNRNVDLALTEDKGFCGKITDCLVPGWATEVEILEPNVGQVNLWSYWQDSQPSNSHTMEASPIELTSATGYKTAVLVVADDTNFGVMVPRHKFIPALTK